MKNLFDIKGKVIVITGGCGILGKNIANYLAEQGAKIVVLDRAAEIGKELEAELNQKSEALFLVTDVLNKEVLEENKKAILERFGTIDVLLNAAGGNMPGATIAPDKTVLDLDVEAFRKVVDLNLFRYSTSHYGLRGCHGKEQERCYRQLLFRVCPPSVDTRGRLWFSQSRYRQLYPLYGNRTGYQVQPRAPRKRYRSRFPADQPESCVAD